MKKDISNRELYEKVGKDYPQDTLLNYYHHFKRMSMVKNLLKSLGDDLRVLDIGCGDGFQTNIYGQFSDITGLDLSEVRIKRAQEKFPKKKFITGDTYNLRLRPENFDVVIMSELIEHLDKPEKALREVFKVVKKGGHVIIDTPSRSNLIDILLRFLGKKPMWGLTIDKTHVAFYSQQELVKLLGNEGFKLGKVRGGPTFRFDRKPFIRWGHNKKRWWILKLIDRSIGLIPYFNQFGAVQVFIFQKI